MGECIDTPTAYRKERYPETSGKEGSSPLDSTQQAVLDNRYSILAGNTGKENEHGQRKRSESVKDQLSPWIHHV